MLNSQKFHSCQLMSHSECTNGKVGKSSLVRSISTGRPEAPETGSRDERTIRAIIGHAMLEVIQGQQLSIHHEAAHHWRFTQDIGEAPHNIEIQNENTVIRRSLRPLPDHSDSDHSDLRAFVAFHCWHTFADPRWILRAQFRFCGLTTR